MIIVHFIRTPARGLLKAMRLKDSLKFPGQTEAELWIAGVKRNNTEITILHIER